MIDADFLGEVLLDDNVRAEIAKFRALHEGLAIKGYLTVVVNKGRPDERVIAQFQPAFEYFAKFQPNLVPTAGRDWVHQQLYTNTAAGTRGAGFIAVSADAVNPAVGDTTLVGEITVGGLARADASTKTHTAGTNVSTIQHVFTATQLFTNLHKSALFNAAGPPPAGQMPHAAAFTTDVGTLASGDTLTITWTLTAG